MYKDIPNTIKITNDGVHFSGPIGTVVIDLIPPFLETWELYLL